MNEQTVTTAPETPGTSTPGTHTEEIKINSDMIVAKVRELIHEGDVRRIIIKNADGQVLLEVPMNVGVAGAAATVIFLPVLAAVGALAAIAANLTVVVERTDTI